MQRFAHFRYAAHTDIGKKRTNNEDAFGVFPDYGIFCVSDGMGGGDDGEVASAATIKAVDGLDMDVGRGEVVGVIGPSGGGKSTLLRCVTHLEPVTGGSIRIAGEDLVRDGVYADRKVRRAICLRMGLVFQNFNLFPHFSVMRNLTEAQIHVLKRLNT